MTTRTLDRLSLPDLVDLVRYFAEAPDLWRPRFASAPKVVGGQGFTATTTPMSGC